jgi:hypothetical protein
MKLNYKKQKITQCVLITSPFCLLNNLILAQETIEDDDLIPTQANPDGNVAIVRIPAPRTYYLSAALSF